MRAREQYLEALGVDLWRLRIPAAVAAPAPIAATAPLTALDVCALPPEAGWEPLREQVRNCRLCGLCETRTQTVFGVGNPSAEIFVIGEAPGEDEDKQGEPFVGRAGQLLNSMLRAMGHPRQTVFIANILKCRPPGNRNPNAAEAASCLPYLERQIDLVRPKLILAVGGIAAKNLLSSDAPVGQMRGKLHRFGPHNTPLIVTYHPAYLLRSPGEKRKVWSDLKFARAELARLRNH